MGIVSQLPVRVLYRAFLKGLGRQLSTRILGAQFKFSVGHGKFAGRDSVIRSNSFCFFCHRDNNRSRLKKVPRLDYSLKTFCLFSTVTRKNGVKKDRSVRTCRPTDAFSWVCLISSPSLGRLELSCWVAGLGIYCHKFLQKQRHLVTSVPSSSRLWNRRYLVNHAQMLPVYAYVV